MEHYFDQNGASGGPSRKNPGSGDRGFWVAAVLFLFFFPCRHPDDRCKAVGRGRKTNVRGSTLLCPAKWLGGGPYGPERGRPGAHPSAPVSSQVLTRLSVQARRLTVIGGILSLIFGFTSVSALAGSLWMLPGRGLVSGSHPSRPVLLFGSLGCLWVEPAEAEQGAALPEIPGDAGLPYCDLHQRPLLRPGDLPRQGAG